MNLTVLLIFYNDPFFYINLQTPGLTLYSITALCRSIFMGYLIIFWLGMLQKMYSEINLELTNRLSIWKRVIAYLYVIISFCESLKFSGHYMSHPEQANTHSPFFML